MIKPRHRDDGNTDASRKEATIEEKLHALRVLNDTDKMSVEVHKSQPKVSVDSLQSMLSQAIHSKDVKMLEECLAVQDQKVITKTVYKLPSKHVVPLLEHIMTRFQSRYTRSLSLTRWLRVILVVHMAQLISQPQLVEKLAKLQQAVDYRAQNYENMIKLMGRLDVIDQQMKIRQDINELNSSKFGQLQEPEVEYNEDYFDGDQQSDDDESIQSSDSEDSNTVESEDERLNGNVMTDDDQYSDYE
ncbi:hypothetical protein MP228_010025 [Amoeboaphelidium protococcarum]|nr:hypothetical protein MP228_010025 [Amoeboaphelidium protococcarum]